MSGEWRLTRESRAALERWLAQREPAPPEELGIALRALVERESSAEPDGAEECLAVADALAVVSAASVRRLLAAGGTDRESALELLAADALATYAFEAAADEPAELERRSLAAMWRFSEVVGGS